MFYKLKGLPAENEIVLCQVTKIYPNSVFVNLLEYNDSGMIHISEVSPGRIRNLRDYVSVGRQIVCKVLRLDREKGHIDLSLRRVNSNQRQQKLEDIKQELKSEQLIKNIAKKLKKPTRELYQEVAAKILPNYSFLHNCFKEIVDGKVNLEKLGLEKGLAQEIEQAVLDKFKPEKIKIEGEISLLTYESDGLKKIKDILTTIEKISNTITLAYLGAGRYKIVVEDFDYPPAEENFDKIRDVLQNFSDKLSKATIQRGKD